VSSVYVGVAAHTQHTLGLQTIMMSFFVLLFTSSGVQQPLLNAGDDRYAESP
jgi:hypothetical protein